MPFGRGRVILEGADTALPIHVYTTKGVLTPFIFKQGTPVKVVFRDQRIGKPTDVFAVPESELTPEQLAELDADIVPGEKIADGKDHVLDGIVGLRGLAELSDKWWLNYRFDIGAGGSDLTWNAAAQIGRRYSWGSLVLGYRYLHYDFDSDFKLMKDLDVYGPVVGAVWEF